MIFRPPSGPARPWLALAAVVSLPLPLAAASSCGTSDPFLASADASAQDTATDSSIVVDSDGRTCDLAKSPREETCINEDRFAVYVSPTGNDANAGTKASPNKTGCRPHRDGFLRGFFSGFAAMSTTLARI
jgi:hypothetical protein